MKNETPQTVNQAVQDLLLAHSVDLARVEAGLQRKILRLLRDVETDLAAHIAAIDPGGVTRSPYRLARLRKLQELVRQTIATAYGRIGRENLRDLSELAGIQAELAHGTLSLALPVSLGVNMAGRELLETLASETLIAGAPTAEWWGKQSRDLREGFMRAMRQGMAEGEGLGRLVQRVRGTRAAGFRDGLMQASRRQAEVLIRSSVQTVANRAREMVWEANPEVIKALMWVSTLDGRTSPQCMARDGLTYGLVDHRPLGHGVPWGAGPGSIHPNCRSTSVPVIRSWREMGLKGLPEGTRASMDGQVPRSLTYETWLKGKPEDFQNRVLGKGKAGLWREGRIGLRELLNSGGRPLTLRELREKLAA